MKQDIIKCNKTRFKSLITECFHDRLTETTTEPTLLLKSEMHRLELITEQELDIFDSGYIYQLDDEGFPNLYLIIHDEQCTLKEPKQTVIHETKSIYQVVNSDGINVVNLISVFKGNLLESRVIANHQEFTKDLLETLTSCMTADNVDLHGNKLITLTYELPFLNPKSLISSLKSKVKKLLGK